MNNLKNLLGSTRRHQLKYEHIGEKCQYGAISTTDEITMGYYVIKLLPED